MKQGWEIKKLGEVCHIVGGGTPSKDNKTYYSGDILWATVRDMKGDYISDTECKITIDAVKNSSTNIISKNNIVIATRVGLGKVCVLNKDAAINQDLKAITPKNTSDLSNRYLYFWFKSISEIIISQGVGATVKGVKLPFIKNLDIPIPLIGEQERIVGILDSAFAKIEALRANAQQNLQNTKDLFQASLKQELTPKQGWEKSTLKEECYKITDGTHQTPKYYESGILFLSSKNVTSGKINWNDVKYIDEIQHNEMHKRVAPQINDVLLAKNGTTGVAAIVDRNVVFDIYVSLALLRTIGNITPEFLLCYVNSPLAKVQFNKRLKGSGVPNLHLEEIRQVTVWYPKSQNEQQSIVEKLDALNEHCRAMEENYRQTIAHCNALKQALLTKAFNGKL